MEVSDVGSLSRFDLKLTEVHLEVKCIVKIPQFMSKAHLPQKKWGSRIYFVAKPAYGGSVDLIGSRQESPKVFFYRRRV
jgi:hypothetical protein